MTRTMNDFRSEDFDTPSAALQSKTGIQRSTRFCLLLALTLTIGCTEAEKPVSKPTTPPTATTPDDHVHKHAGHGAGPHDGTLADWGGGKFHVEFCVDHDKQEATVYILGEDEKTTAPIKTGTILLSINDPRFQVELTAVPLEGEAEGTASRFVGKHTNLGKVQEFSGTISGEVENTPYVGDFKEEPHGEHEHKK